MANTINWGNIYSESWWGSPQENGWGNVYYDDANPSPTPFFEVLAEGGEYVITEQNEYVIIE